ncbi:MAG: hypothetical protein Q9182_006840 [Xanthomendoza sp. 2 TL-2023]
MGIVPQSAVSIALPNSYEFIVAFLATTRQRAIAAPLNPLYKQDEFEFYIEDLKSAAILVPRDFHPSNGPAIQAARKHHAAIAECFWNGREVVLDVKDPGSLIDAEQQAPHEAQPDDIALVLHTSGTTGRPKADGREVPQGSRGEICIRGQNVTKGYLNNPEANKASFTPERFFRTGDQGVQDEDGYVMITGRIKELINKGGEKISPVEIDDIIAQHPAVVEAVSFAISDDMYGQDVGVAVVLEAGAQVSMDELRQWMATRVARYKVAKQIYFTKVMPKTATGKIQRRKVADAMLEALGSRAKL